MQRERGERGEGGRNGGLKGKERTTAAQLQLRRKVLFYNNLTKQYLTCIIITVLG